MDINETQWDAILADTYACTRVWEGWLVGTMTQHDFQPTAECEVRDDLIAWRNAEVAAELRRMAREFDPSTTGVWRAAADMLLSRADELAA